jgi:predicted transcriptional regulator
MPIVDKRNARQSALKTLVNRFFEGSPQLLMMNLLEDEQLSPELLQQLKDRIEEVP